MEEQTWSLKTILPTKVVSSIHLTTTTSSVAAFPSSSATASSSSATAAAVAKQLIGAIPPRTGKGFGPE